MEWILFGIFLPFLGTVLGAGLVLLLPGICERHKGCLCALSAGAMLASGIWSLLQPALEQAFLPTAAGFAFGMLVLILPDRLLERRGRKMDPTTLLMLAVVLHNIPEGLAVGAGYTACLSSGCICPAEAVALSLGIAVQNIPDGAVAVVPLAASGIGPGRAFRLGVLSGAVEPLAVVTMVLFAPTLADWLPLLMGFAAGAMFCVVVEELIPGMHREPSPMNMVWFALGFLAMMGIDVFIG